jgi:hypothetical protein
MTSPASSPRPPRNRALVVVDIIASVILVIFAAVLALAVITTAVAYQGLTAECGAGPFDGLTCNATALSVVTIGMIVVAVLGAFLGFGFFLVNLIRKRYTVWWPLGAVVAMVVATWVGSWVAGMIAP